MDPLAIVQPRELSHSLNSKFEAGRGIRRSLNALLPETIRILSIDPVADDFHARYSATSKIYHYHVQLDPIFSPFERLYRWQPPFRIDLPRLRDLARASIGKRDFRSFSNRKDDDTIRHLMRLDIVEQEGGIRLEYEGDGFLYKMVRNLTGTLLAYSAEKGAEDLEKVFTARDRRAAGAAAPAQGLFLMQVIYTPSSSKAPKRIDSKPRG
jgi:tRNA pseudouridine38-40 synthase